MDYTSIILKIIGSKKNQKLFENNGYNLIKKRIIGPSFVDYTQQQLALSLSVYVASSHRHLPLMKTLIPSLEDYIQLGISYVTI